MSLTSNSLLFTCTGVTVLHNLIHLKSLTCRESEKASFCSLFSIGLKSSFFFSLSLMSGLAALTSIFRLEVGVHGSARGLSTGLIGVIGFFSGVQPFCFDKSIGSFFRGVFGAILD